MTPINPKFLRIFAAAAREEGDEDTALIVTLAADRIDRLQNALITIGAQNSVRTIWQCAQEALEATTP